MQDKQKELSELRGRVKGLETVLGMLLYELFRNGTEQSYRMTRVNWAIKELVKDYTRVPFMLSDEESQGFRDVLDQLSDSFDKHDNTPSSEIYESGFSS